VCCVTASGLCVFMCFVLTARRLFVFVCVLCNR
jgi:hypothetical protein